MRRGSSKLARMVRALPLLLLGAQATPDPLCQSFGADAERYGPFVTRASIAIGQPVTVRPGTVLAHESLQYAYRSWRTRDAIRLPSPNPLLYPAGTPVTTTSVNFHDFRPCLPTLGPARRYRDRYLACLVDRDLDGAYDAVQRISSLDGAQRSMPRDLGTVPLPAQISLADDAEGDPWSRNHAHRRIEVEAITGDTVHLLRRDTIHQSNDHIRAPAIRTVAFDDAPDGIQVYRIARVATAQVEADDAEAGARHNPVQEAVRLANGATIRFGGLRFRAARVGAAWTLTPLDPAFPLWIARRCDSRALHIARPG